MFLAELGILAEEATRFSGLAYRGSERTIVPSRSACTEEATSPSSWTRGVKY